MRPQLARSALDRSAHRRGDQEWLDQAWRRSQVIIVDPERGHTHVAGKPPTLAFFAPEAAPDGERLYLGGESDPYFAVIGTVDDGAGLREIGPQLSDFDAGLLTEALALARWHAEHRFHPADGTPLHPSSGGWELRAGDKVAWPRTDPAVMVFITDGADRCLLARGLGWGEGRFSCIAGFVEPGESAEAACHREVSEEVGVQIADLSYVASQPWPFPRSLMLAYDAVADPTQPTVLQPDEISQARWFHRDEVRAALEGRPAPLRNHPSISISRFLLQRWAGS